MFFSILFTTSRRSFLWSSSSFSSSSLTMIKSQWWWRWCCWWWRVTRRMMMVYFILCHWQEFVKSYCFLSPLNCWLLWYIVKYCLSFDVCIVVDCCYYCSSAAVDCQTNYRLLLLYCVFNIPPTDMINI